jgi:hypothetical protein
MTARRQLDLGEAQARLRGAAVTGVEYVRGENEDEDYVVLHFGDLTLYADAPTLYASLDAPERGAA